MRRISLETGAPRLKDRIFAEASVRILSIRVSQSQAISFVSYVVGHRLEIGYFEMPKVSPGRYDDGLPYDEHVRDLPQPLQYEGARGKRLYPA